MKALWVTLLLTIARIREFTAMTQHHAAQQRLEEAWDEVAYATEGERRTKIELEAMKRERYLAELKLERARSTRAFGL